MTDFFHSRNHVYPLFCILESLIVFVVSLSIADSVWGGIFLLLHFLLLVFFGCARLCFFMLPFAVLYSFVLSAVFYFASGRDSVFAQQMAVRFFGVALSCVPGLSLPPSALVRNLTALRCPRMVTLGFLITLSFVPVLASEIRQIRGAMKTRGATSFCHPSVLYRAFLLPLVVRLLNISDTLALSVETKAFVDGGARASVYKPVKLGVRDAAFMALSLFFSALCVVFFVLEKKS